MSADTARSTRRRRRPVGGAEGSRAAAAALACAGADVDRATLLVELAGKPPRPTLLASAAARRLEERLGGAPARRARVAARGQVCHLRSRPIRRASAVASAAVSVARGSLAVVYLPAAQLRPAARCGPGPEPSGVLLRADLGADRALLALAVRDLLGRGFSVGVLKHASAGSPSAAPCSAPCRRTRPAACRPPCCSGSSRKGHSRHGAPSRRVGARRCSWRSAAASP